MLGEKNDRALGERSISPIVKQRNGFIMLWECSAASAQEILCGWKEESIQLYINKLQNATQRLKEN